LYVPIPRGREVSAGHGVGQAPGARL